ncbi:hypothetical protein Q7P37_008232 [Cladosporium fusiforme]
MIHLTSSISAILAISSSLCAAQDGLVINPKNADHHGSGERTIPVDLTDLRNNRAFAMSPGDADFDGIHSGYPAQYLPASNLTYSGVKYDFPQYQESGDDNVLAQGQILAPEKGRYISVHMLAAAESAIATGFVNTTYSDNSTASTPILVDPYKDWPYPYGGDIIFPYSLTNSSLDFNRSMIFQIVTWLDASKELTSLQLPNVTSGAAGDPGGESQDTRLHIFAVTMVPATETGIALEVQYARSTQMWVEGTNKTQIVEVMINNVGEEWVLANNSVRVTVESPGLTTVQSGVINRLRPGDQARVQVGVVNTDGTAAGMNGEASIRVNGQGVQSTSYDFNATYGVAPYEATYESIYGHESPTWFGTSAKYGIFIHWGVYSVPAWGNVGKNESYAEWYWWSLNNGPGAKDQTWEHHLETYGENFVYDDFITNFTASVFEPKDWVDLFADAGAQYFVQVSKHHDGYAIFDLPANVSNRTSVALQPHRNLLQELFDAADQYHPHLHKGTYYSLPEWFHPDYKEYGFASWPGGNATNPYTNATLAYTGYVPVEDYIQDLIIPEMETLAAMGTEIMWCDIGGPNMTADFAASYFNRAAAAGKQVLLNNRCGLPGDFDTPEYARYDAVQVRKWESNLGMDPFSYGYNAATPDEAYLKPDQIVTSLMDIVSKNGNFLLDVGPTANGTIIEIQQRYLRLAGAWIKEHGEAVFNTTYWFVTPEEGQAVRFTQNEKAFYITTLYPPNSTLVLDSPVPYVEGDDVRVVGGNRSGDVVPSRLLENGSLELTVGEGFRDADRYAWVFKIDVGGVDSGNGSMTNGSRPSGTGQPVATQTTSGSGRMEACMGLVVGLVLSLAFGL